MTTKIGTGVDVPPPNRPDTYYFQYWDCQQCFSQDAKHLNAVWEKFCPKCGHPMKDEWCYDDKDAPEIKDRESLMIAKGGDNWNCEYCEVVNFEKAEFCSGCGINKLNGKTHPAAPQPKPAHVVQSRDQGQRQAWKGFDLWRVGIFLAVLVSLGLLMYGFWWYFLNTTEVTVIVDHPYWTVSVPMQEYKGIPGSGSSLPANATVDSKGTKVVGYGQIQGQDGVTRVPTEKSVIVGWGRCRVKQDNGTVVEADCATKENQIVDYGENRVAQYTQVPTYGPHYEYHIMGWVPGSPVSFSGYDYNPHPPVVIETETYKVDGPPQYGYYMYFKESSKNMHVFDRPIPFFTEKDWRAAATKQFIGHVNQVGVLVRISETK